MKNEVQVTQEKLQREIVTSLVNATSIITKNYLCDLGDGNKYNIYNPSWEETDNNILVHGKLYQLSKLVFNKDESFLDKLTTIINVVSSIECKLVTIIKSNGIDVEYYIGIISNKFRQDRDADKNRRVADVFAFKGALSGNLVGSDLRELSCEEAQQVTDNVFGKQNQSYASVSGIVALRDKEEKSIESYVQGIENLVDSLKGQKYTIITIADPISSSEIQVIKQGYEMLHTQLSTFCKTVMTINESDSVSLSKAHTKGITEGISKGISLTQSTTNTKGTSHTVSGNVGVNASAGIPFVASAGVSVSMGYAYGRNSSTSDTTGRTTSENTSMQRNRQTTSTEQSGRTAGSSLQLNYENRSIKTLMDKIDVYLERLDECESYGAFNCAAYVIADTKESALAVASNYNALMRGKDSSIQSSHINTWSKSDDVKIIEKYLSSFVHPRFVSKNDKNIVVTPASIISGNEMAIQIGLPKKSVAGVTVIPMAPFGRNVHESNGRKLTLGSLYHMGNDEGSESCPRNVDIDVESLSMHTFITGSTGSGKSTVIYELFDKLMETNVKDNPKEKIKFMVIEPAKGEYKDRFGYYKDVKVYGTNFKKTPLLRINPFSFPEDIHILEHIDRLVEIFNVCWPMYAAMPAVLKDAIERAYIVSGWKLDVSECKYSDSNGKPLYPNFVDVLNQINIVINESQYSKDSKGDYKGALCTRLKSMTNGLYGQIFTCDELSASELFDENVIVDLSRTGSVETKSLIMGLLIMKLQEHRMSTATGGNQPLKHITVLEEAHNILKRTSTEQSSESSNVLGKSVEMLANSIAEMRTYGEAFIIADQAPGLMDMSVIRNTNTKIILRLPDLSDRELVGRAAGLNDEQILELSKLKTFVAAVYQNNWLEAVLCNIHPNFKESKKYKMTCPVSNKDEDVKEFVRILINPVLLFEKDRNYIDSLAKSCWGKNIPAETKVAFSKYVKATEVEEIDMLRKKILFDIFNAQYAFGVCQMYESEISSWYIKMREVLEPSVDDFNKDDFNSIISILVSEKDVREGTEVSKQLQDRVINYCRR